MSVELTSYTDALSLEQAKKLLELIEEGGDSFRYIPPEDPMTAKSEVRLKGVSRVELGEIELPHRCTQLRISTFGSRICVDSIPDSLGNCFLGGVEYPIPDYGWACSINIGIVLPRSKCAVGFVYQVDNTMKVLGRPYDICHITEISRHSQYGEALDGISPSVESVDQKLLLAEIQEIWTRFGLPSATAEGCLEVIGSHFVTFDPEKSAWGWSDFVRMLKVLEAGSPVKAFSIASFADLGAMMSGPDDLRSDALSLIKEVVTSSQYEYFDLTYTMVASMGWDDLENVRGRHKKRPLVKRSGKIVFGNNGAADVILLISKKGYALNLEFDSVEALKIFTKSQLYSATDWLMAE